MDSRQLSTPESSQYNDFAVQENAISSFASSLSEKGYSPVSVKIKVKIVIKFCRWFEKQKLSYFHITDNVFTAFFDENPRAGHHIRRGELSALHQYLTYLREVGILPPLVLKRGTTELDRIECDFSQYLREERGVTRATIDNYVAIIRRFLIGRFGSENIVMNDIKPYDITQFIILQVRNKTKKSAQVICTALRVFFRFLRYRGDTTIDLSGCVPTVANRHLSELPKSLDSQKVADILNTCVRNTAIGRRDFAILLLLTRLGLRAGEIVAMSLDDFDWDNGIVAIHGKGSKIDKLPIPQDVGEAIVTYLMHGRASCETRSVFVRTRAPYQGFSSSVAVDNVVQRALNRAGLDPAHKGAQMLRHSLACRMLERGVSLAHIGEVLRHSQSTTTEIYAKVNFQALSSLVLPWPGGAS
jgi:site-specific recombinase XerD